jgi:hypothetical protein
LQDLVREHGQERSRAPEQHAEQGYQERGQEQLVPRQIRKAFSNAGREGLFGSL